MKRAEKQNTNLTKQCITRKNRGEKNTEKDRVTTLKTAKKWKWRENKKLCRNCTKEELAGQMEWMTQLFPLLTGWLSSVTIMWVF